MAGRGGAFVQTRSAMSLEAEHEGFTLCAEQQAAARNGSEGALVTREPMARARRCEQAEI